MRITYLSAAAIPSRAANSIQVMKMCEAMAKEGHDVTLLAPRGWGWGQLMAIDGSVWLHYGVEANFDVKWLPAPGPRPSYPYGIVAAAYAFLRRQDALVYARHLPGALVAAILRRRVVFEVHEPPSAAGRLREALFSTLTRRRTLERVVVISEALRGALVAQWPILDTDRVVVAPDGVNLGSEHGALSPAEARARLGVESGDRFTAGYVGHLYGGRGVDLILEMAQRLPDVSFLLVGGEPDDVARLKTAVRDAGLKNVTITGFVPPADVPLHLAACDVLLMPYQRRLSVAGSGNDTAAWMSPLKMFEYLAAGRLVIASDLPVLREVLSDDVAVLAPPEDVDAWCDAIRHATADGEWVRERAIAARRAAEGYTWQRRVALCLPSG